MEALKHRMRSIKELMSLAAEFGRYLTGNDYFRKRQGLGPYFQDPRCYYNDLRHKADWDGAVIGGLPALHMINSGQDILLPIMVLLYGLGNIDRYFLDNNPARLEPVGRVGEWFVSNLLPEGYFDNAWSERHPTLEFYSNNSAMSQGLALSFAVRAIQYDLVDGELRGRLEALVEQIVANMLRPSEQNGTALYRGEDVYLLEDCEKESDVVLNGWIFGLFGLYDYLRLCTNDSVQGTYRATVDTLRRALPRYRLTSGWSYYDERGRISSPFYHDLHIVQLDAMHRLTGIAEFAIYRDVFRLANHRVNKIWYTLNKIKDRLLDQNALGR